jgi:hypothetical protein
MANRPLMISAYDSQLGSMKPPAPSGSDRPRGSKPKSPGKLQAKTRKKEKKTFVSIDERQGSDCLLQNEATPFTHGNLQELSRNLQEHSHIEIFKNSQEFCKYMHM